MTGDLHLSLDPPAARSLARRANADAGSPAARWAERWVFLDTASHAFLRAGIAVVMVGRGRTWTHRVVAAPDGPSPWTEAPVEWPAPGGRSDLSALPDAARRRMLARLAARVPVGPVGEASVRRTRWALPDGVKLTCDRIAIAGPDGTGLGLPYATLGPAGAAALCAAAAHVPGAGERLGAVPPELAARAACLERPPSRVVRNAHPVLLAADLTAASAAVAVLRECAAQVRANTGAVRAGAGSEGPHQLRVGLRRLRAALGLFRGAIGGPAADRLAAEARWLAGVVGRLRDLDVMREDVVLPEAAAHSDEPGFARLADALQAQADRTRADLCQTLAGDRAQRFLVDVVIFTECAGWHDHGRGAPGTRPDRTAQSIGTETLERRWRKVGRMARNLDRMDMEARHALRKELKKLRYGAEFLGPLFAPARVAPFVTRLKALQEVFGTLNDAAMATTLLSGADAPAADDPAAARAAGRVIGARIVRAERDWDSARALWTKLERTRPFWRRDGG